MDDIATMTVVDCGEHLLYDVGRIAFTKKLLLRNSFKELTTVAKPIKESKFRILTR